MPREISFTKQLEDHQMGHTIKAEPKKLDSRTEGWISTSLPFKQLSSRWDKNRPPGSMASISYYLQCLCLILYNKRFHVSLSITFLEPKTRYRTYHNYALPGLCLQSTQQRFWSRQKKYVRPVSQTFLRQYFSSPRLHRCQYWCSGDDVLERVLRILEQSIGFLALRAKTFQLRHVSKHIIWQAFAFGIGHSKIFQMWQLVERVRGNVISALPDTFR